MAKIKFIPNPKLPVPVLPNSVIDNLSSDQYYTYRIGVTGILGSVDASLELLEVGLLIHYTMVNT